MAIIAGLGSIFFAMLVIFWPKQKEQVVGSPCAYKTTNYPAQIIAIDDFGADEVDATCLVFLDGYQDTVSYYMENSHGIDPRIIATQELQVGDSVIYEHKEITEGSCSPTLFRLIIKDFKTLKK